jgi:hypothetical protein
VIAFWIVVEIEALMLFIFVCFETFWAIVIARRLLYNI